MSDLSPILALPYLLPSQAQKHVTHNEALRRLDLLVQLAVSDRTLTQPPVSPVVGERHIVAAGATGPWAGQDGRIALYETTGWSFHAPDTGWMAQVLDENRAVLFDGTDWVLTAIGLLPADLHNLPGIGINTGIDPFNRLSVAAGATLLTHEGTGHQLKINKASSTDTASLLFQTGWTGHAEMGLSGNDDFSIRISPDGATFMDAVVVDGATGMARFPHGLGGSGSAAGQLGNQVCALTCESAAASAGSNFSFGDGAGIVTGGATMPFAGKLMAATMTLASGAVGLYTAQLVHNGTLDPAISVSASYIVGGETGVSDFRAAPPVFAATDRLGWQMTTAVAAAASQITFFVTFD